MPGHDFLARVVLPRLVVPVVTLSAAGIAWSAPQALGEWTTVRENPFVLGGQAVAVDGERGILYAFGGADPDPVSASLHRQDLAQPFVAWTLESSGGGPSARTLAHAFFDERRRRLIVLGGENGGTALRDAWAYDPDTHTWSLLASAASAPPALDSRTPLAWDRRDDRLLYLDGTTPGRVWVLPLATPAPSWVQLTTSGVPDVRTGGAATCDSLTNRLFVLGGGDSLDAATQLWQLDLANGEWTILLGAGPLGTITPWLAVDPFRRVLFARGGTAPPGVQPSARAAEVPLDSAPSWNVVHPSGEPNGTDGLTEAYDARGQRFIGIGFEEGTPLVADLSTRDIAWTKRWRPGRPLTFANAATAIDPAARWWYVHGGWSMEREDCGTGPIPCICPRLLRISLDDPGAIAEVLVPIGSGPSPLRGHAAVFDSIGHRILFHGGIDGTWTTRSETWALELGPPLHWSLLPTRGAEDANGIPGPIPARFSHGLAIDDAGRFVYAIGGGPGTANLWRLDLATSPATWAKYSLVTPGLPSAAGFDPVSRRLIVTTDGAGYTVDLRSGAQISAQVLMPAQRAGAGFAYDRTNRRMLVHNGYTPCNCDSIFFAQSSLLAFDGAMWWSLASNRGGPTAIGQSAYDPVSGRLLSLNGQFEADDAFLRLAPQLGMWAIALGPTPPVTVELVEATRDEASVRLAFRTSPLSAAVGVERRTPANPLWSHLGYASQVEPHEYVFLDTLAVEKDGEYRGWWISSDGLHYTKTVAFSSTPARLDLVDVVGETGGIRVTFSGEGVDAGGIVVERTPALLEDWTVLGAAAEVTPGTWVHLDDAAPVATAVRYRGRWRDEDGVERVTAASAAVTRPGEGGGPPATLSLRARDGVVGRGWPVAFECRLQSSGSGRLELVDVRGRIVARHTVGGEAGRTVVLELSPERAASGVWFARLRQDGAVVTTRFVRL